MESIEAKSVAGDSIAMSNDRKLAWLSVRTTHKKDWIKIHTLIDIETTSKVAITKGTAGAAPPMTKILESLEGLTSEPHKGHLTRPTWQRKFCTLLKDLGWTPVIKPKSNTPSNAKGI